MAINEELICWYMSWLFLNIVFIYIYYILKVFTNVYNLLFLILAYWENGNYFILYSRLIAFPDSETYSIEVDITMSVVTSTLVHTQPFYSALNTTRGPNPSRELVPSFPPKCRHKIIENQPPKRKKKLKNVSLPTISPTFALEWIGPITFNISEWKIY